MSISTRLEAINQHLLDDYLVLTLAGADLTNVDKNIVNLKQTWKERLLYFMNNGTDIVWNNWEKVIGEGTSLTLNNTLEAKMKIDLKGNTSQEGTPTPDSPQDIQVVSGDNSIKVEGKNLFDKDSATQGYYYNANLEYVSISATQISDYIKVNSGSDYTVSYTKMNSSETTIRINYFNGNKEIQQQITDISSTSGYRTYTFTIPNNIEYVRFSTTTNQSYIDQNTIQLEKGNQATTYTPYVSQSYPISLGSIELCKIGDYQDKIAKSTGKNLFDKDNANMLSAYINDDNNTIISSGKSKTIYISCKPNTTYTISKIKATARFVIGTTTSIPDNNVTCNQVIANNTATSITITTGANDKYLCAFIYHSDNDSPLTLDQVLSYIQIEYGSSATSYEPYGTGDWYKYGAIGKVVLTGGESENWGKFFSTDGVFANRDYTSISSSATVNCVCNYYTAVTRNQIRNNLDTSDKVCATYGTELIIANKSTSSVNDFKTWLSTHNTILYTILETPTYTQITDIDLIGQLNDLEGARSYDNQTNVSQTNNDKPFILDLTALKEM